MSLPRPTSPAQSNPRWLLTTEAWSSLLAEVARLEDEVGSDSPPAGVVRIPSADPARRLRVLRDLRNAAVVDDAPGIAVIGRRVTIAEDDGTVETYALVLPGDGDPSQGWVSADSPLGTAVLGARGGEAVSVTAPAGVRRIDVVRVE